jgi:hypothetical protein
MTRIQRSPYVRHNVTILGVSLGSVPLCRFAGPS